MTSRFYRDFFGPWETPPVFTPSPADPALVQRIRKLADFASRNGPQFVSLFKEKQQHNPEYGFLMGAEGNDYYRWCLHCLLLNQPIDPTETEASQQHHSSSMDKEELLAMQNTQSSMNNQLSEIGKEYSEILDALDGTKESIKAAQNWFMKYGSSAEELAKLMHLRILELNDLNAQLRIVYVIDEILFKSHGYKHEEHLIYQSFKPLIVPILTEILTHANYSEDIVRKLKKLLNSWLDDGIYDPDTIEEFEYVFKGEKSESGLSSSRSKSYERKTTIESKTSSLPPHILSSSKSLSSSHSWGHPSQGENAKQNRRSESTQTRAAFDPPPVKSASGKRLHDSLSFPPGLIPKLVSEKRKHTFSYTQISPADIENAGASVLADPNDPYLKSRVEKFYAELEEYRPGMVREHVESRKRSEETDNETEAQKRARHRTGHSAGGEDKFTSMLPDGSFAGEGSDTMYAGLGARTQSRKSEQDSVFESYRKLRSDVYHNSIPRGTSTSRRTR